MKNLVIVTIIATTIWSADAMLASRLGVELTKKSTNALLKTYVRKMSTTSEDAYELKNPLAQIIAGIPAGWLGSMFGGVLGFGAGAAVGVMPAILLDDHDIFAYSAVTGGVLGGVSGGALSSLVFAGPRGVISCAAVSATLYGIGHWKEKKNNY
jgi:hypothetical protein